MKTSRRFFLSQCAAASAAGTLSAAPPPPLRQKISLPINLAVIGTGGRGTHLLSVALHSGKVNVSALCDINDAHLQRAARRVVASTGAQPAILGKDADDWRNLLTIKNVDAVLIATPIQLHAPMAAAALRAGKHVLSEVPAAITLAGCWDIVRAEEESGCLYMMSENCCYWRHTLAVARMVDLGLFGELTYAECGYVHNCRGILFDSDDQPTWRGRIMGNIIGNAYPTHAIGPVAQWLGAGRGNRFLTLVAMMTGQKSFRAYLDQRLPPESPWRQKPFANGDSTTVLIRTERGVVIDLRYDIVSPRPHPQTTYFALQGTKGSYESRWNGIWIEGRSTGNQWEDFNRYQAEFEHPLWQTSAGDAQGSGHGGADYFVVNAFLDALAAGRPSPIGAAEAAMWSAITPLSGQSITGGSAPVSFPNFFRV